MRFAPSTPPSGLTLFMRTRRRIQYAVPLLLSLMLVVLGRINHPFTEGVHRALTYTLTPLIVALDAVRESVAGTGTWVGQWVVLERENTQLRKNNSRLQHWRVEAKRLVIENQRLQELLNLRPTALPSITAARVLSAVGGVYSRSVLVHAGTRDGVKVGLPVVDESGIVGRVVRVGTDASRVLLVTDLNSRVAVQTMRARLNAIAVGQNGDFLELLYLPDNPDVEVGEIVLTSGADGIFPADLTLGIVSTIAEGKVFVKPVAKLSQLDFVSFLNYETSSLEPPASP